MLEIIAVRLRHPAPMPRHLLQTLSRLGNNDRRCAWYYANYGRSNSASSYDISASAAAAGGGGGGAGGGWGVEAEFVVAERRPEWDKAYIQAPRGSIRVGFQSVSRACSACKPLSEQCGGGEEYAVDRACAVVGEMTGSGQLFAYIGRLATTATYTAASLPPSVCLVVRACVPHCKIVSVYRQQDCPIPC